MTDEEELMITEYMENRTPSPQYSPAEYLSESETEETIISLVESITEKDITTSLKKSAIISKVKKIHQKPAEKPTGIKNKKRFPHQEKKTCWIKIMIHKKYSII